MATRDNYQYFWSRIFGLSSEIAQGDLHFSKRRRLILRDLVNAVTSARLVECWDNVRNGPFVSQPLARTSRIV
jgi:hypothetical protein